MSLSSNLRFKWRVRRSILALQSAGYVTLPFDGANVLAFHWADPQNRILFQPSRTNVRVGREAASLASFARVVGQVTCYPGSSESSEGGVPLATRTAWEWPVTIGGWQYVNTVGELRAVALVHASRVRTDY